MSEYTEGELKFVYSSKHPGDVFIKIKHTKDTFLCKFYGGNGKISPNQALVNANHFLKCRNSHKALVEALEFAVNPKAPYKVDQLEFANNIIKAIAEKAEAALAQVKQGGELEI